MARINGLIATGAMVLVACGPSIAVDSGSSSTGDDPCVDGECTPETSASSISDTSPPDTGEVDSTPPDTSATSSTMTDTATDSTADESSSEGPPLPCGNGRLDDGEVCDDGNTESGDGCNADCEPGGQEIWTANFDGGSQLDDWGHRVATDADDNVIVVGIGFGLGETERNGLIIKYDGDGQLLWDERYDSEQSISTDFFWGVAVLPDQSIVVAGTSTNEMGQMQPMVRSYDEGGNEQWTYFEPNDGDGRANDVVVDSVGDIVVTGYVHDPDTLEPRAWLAKFASDGELIWNLRLEMPDGGGNIVLARDSTDALVMAGGVGVVHVRKLDSDGDELWTWTEALDGQGALRGAAVGSNDDIFVGGGHLENPTSSYLARVPSNGDDPLWSDSWGGKLGGSAYGAAVAVDSVGRVVLVGNHFGNGEQAIVARKYSGDGDPLWVHQAEGLPNGYDFPHGVAVDSQDNIVISGRRPGEGGSYDIFVRKLTQ